MTLVSEEENKRRFDNCIEFINNMKPPKFMEWWTVENTGWSGGISWFDSEVRFQNENQAIEYIQKTRWDDPAVKWRYVHVTLERENNKAVTTEVWTEVL